MSYQGKIWQNPTEYFVYLISIRHLPNALSILRIILAVPITIALLKEQYFITLVLFFISAITDALDGFIAKHFDASSVVGSILDPMADKILITTALITLAYMGLVPIWVLVIILLRDIMLVAGTVGYYYDVDFKKTSGIMPTNISKINTVLQILTVLLIIGAQLYSPILDWLYILYITVATSTIISGVDYAWIWLQHAINKSRH